MHPRKSPRANRIDYSASWWYFITICVKDRLYAFGEIEDGEMKLNGLGKECGRLIEQICKVRDNVIIDEYIVMPDHVHILLLMNEKKHEYDGRRRDGSLNRPDDNNNNHNDNSQIRIGSGRIIDASLQRLDWNNMEQGTWNDHQTERRDGSLNRPVDINRPDEIKINRWSITIWSIVKLFKWNVTKYAKNNDIIFWRQSRYYDRVIRNEWEYERIKYYIQNNPQNREKDQEYENRYWE
jgi:putative transposase